MKLRNGLVAAAIGAGVVVSATACGPGYPQAEYCVDNAGHVMPANYCQPSYPMYGSYFVFYGSLHGHSYATGQVIPRSYIVTGREVRANNSSGLKAAGLPASGAFKNGTTVKPTPPAKPQSPPASGGMKSTPKSSTGTSKVGGFSGGTKSTFGGSTRSSFGGGFRSSGGRK